MPRELTCAEVLANLSDYVDGDLSTELREAVEHHLAGCDNCTRFGGEYASVVTSLRTKLKAAAEPPDDVMRRLDQALQR